MHRLDRLGLLLAALLLLLRALPLWGLLLDDAWIPVRYVDQLLAGNGLVYNQGQPAIEGFTSPAWVVLLIAGMAMGAEPQPLLELAGFAGGLLTLRAAAALVRALGDPPPGTAGAVALFLALDPHLAAIATNGLESSTFCAALAGCMALALRRSPALGPALFVLGWLRPEGLAAALLIGAWALLERRWLPLAAALLSGLVLLGVRLALFGTLLPNTAHARHAGSFLDRLGSNLHHLSYEAPYWIGLVGLLLLGTLVPGRGRKMAGAVAGIVLMAASQVHLWSPGGRLLLPAGVLALALGASPVALALQRAPLWIGSILGAALLLLLVGPLPQGVAAAVRAQGSGPDTPAEQAALHLRRHLPPGSTVAIRDAGLFARTLGPEITVLETHPRAVNRPHPGGADTPEALPFEPEVIINVVLRENATEPRFASERRMLEQHAGRYRHLGRVRRAEGRAYDLWLRDDLVLPPR